MLMLVNSGDFDRNMIGLLQHQLSGIMESSLYFIICCVQAQCIAGIVEYIKAHPNASEADLTKEVEKHVALFKERVQSM